MSVRVFFSMLRQFLKGLKHIELKMVGHIVTFRPDLNASRMADSARRLEMPVFPEDRFIKAVEQVVAANADYVPPYGSGATLYIRPYICLERIR